MATRQLPWRASQHSFEYDDDFDSIPIVKPTATPGLFMVPRPRTQAQFTAQLECLVHTTLHATWPEAGDDKVLYIDRATYKALQAVVEECYESPSYDPNVEICGHYFSVVELTDDEQTPMRCEIASKTNWAVRVSDLADEPLDADVCEAYMVLRADGMMPLDALTAASAALSDVLVTTAGALA